MDNINPVYDDGELEINDYGDAVEVIDHRNGSSILARTPEQYAALSDVFISKLMVKVDVH